TEVGPASFGCPARPGVLHEIASSGTEQRRTYPAQVGQHEFARAPRTNWPAAFGFDHLGNVRRFEYVQHAWSGGASVAGWSHFRHAMMIHDARTVPELGDVGAGSRDAASRLAGHE